MPLIWISKNGYFFPFKFIEPAIYTSLFAKSVLNFLGIRSLTDSLDLNMITSLFDLDLSLLVMSLSNVHLPSSLLDILLFLVFWLMGLRELSFAALEKAL